MPLVFCRKTTVISEMKEIFIFLSTATAAILSSGTSHVNVELDSKATVNVIGIDHPFVCVNFDWWPNEKCDYGNCSWVDNGKYNEVTENLSKS